MLVCSGPLWAQSLSSELAFLSQYQFDTLPELAVYAKAEGLILLTNSPSPDWKIEWDLARKSLQDGDLKAAENHYRAVLDIKNLLEVRWELANMLVVGSNANVEEALSIIEILYEEEPDRLDFLAALAVLQLRVGKFERAAASLETLLAVQPDNKRAIAGVVYAYLNLNKPEKAFPYLTRLVDDFPSDFSLLQLYTRQAFALGHGEYAYGKIHLLVHDSKADLGTFVLAATVADRQGEKSEAAGYWERVVSLDPKNNEGHQWLAQYYEQTGEVEKAVEHFLVLNALHPDDSAVIRKIGQCYVGMKEFAKALTYFEDYIDRVPNDKEAVRFVVNIEAALGNKDATLAALEHYFAIESSPDKVNLERAAQLYDEHGLAREAIAIYRRLLAMSPDDPALLTSLANNFLQIGNDADALRTWQQLAEVVPKVVEVYKPIAALLEKMGRFEELLGVLEVIAELDPDDVSIQLQLVERYLNSDRLEPCSLWLDRLSASTQELPEKFYRLRGRYLVRTAHYELAYPDLQRVLSASPDDVGIRLEILDVAGKLGDLEMARQHFQALQHAGAEVDLVQLLASAQVFMEIGSYAEARELFGTLTQMGASMGPLSDLSKQAFVGMAQCYRKENLPHEAEATLRQGLALSQDYVRFVPLLFDLNYKNGWLNGAEEWLAVMREARSADSSWFEKFAEARLLLARDEGRQARRELRQLFTMAVQNISEAGHAKDALLPEAQAEDLLETFYNAGEFQRAQRLSEEILRVDSGNSFALVVLKETGGGLEAERQKLLSLDTIGVSHLLDLAGSYEKIGRYDEMEAAASRALSLWPQSFRAALLQTKALTFAGKIKEAEERYAALSKRCPTCLDVKIERARLLFFSGKFDELVRFVDAESGATIPEQLLLLKARALWRQDHKKDALSLYEMGAQEQIVEVLRGLAATYGVTLPQIVYEPTPLERIFKGPVFSYDKALLGVVMSPAYFLEKIQGGQPVYLTALSKLYAEYRWQQKFAMETELRDALRKEEYFYALRLCGALTRQYPDDEALLYDLAEINGMLGELGREAALYEKLLAEGAHIEGLEDSLARNHRLQQPQVALTTGYFEEKGYNNYKDMGKTWQTLSLWYSPRTQHKAFLDLSRINYRARSWDDVVRANRAELGYSATLFSGFTLGATGGVETQDEGDNSTVVLGVKGESEIGDAFVGSFNFTRDVVTDTTASLRRDIIRQELQGGVAFDPFYRLRLGGDYSILEYSDTNWTTGYDLWASYLVLANPVLLTFRYGYDFKESNEGETAEGIRLSDGFYADDHPYWAPKNYWSNKVGVSLRYEMARAVHPTVPNYYQVDYYFGHDSEGNGFQELGGGLFVELSPHFLLSAQGELSSSPVYRHKQYSVKASYRW